MKKSIILGLAALTLAIGLGISLPTYATAAAQTTVAPTYNDINRAISSLKSTGQYYEYATLIQDINTGRTYRLASDLLAIDDSLNLSNKTNTELVNIAKTLPNYDLYVYLYNLVDYTENWLPNYYSATPASQKEAYDAVNDAVIACGHLLKKSTVTAPTTSKTAATKATTTTAATATVEATADIQVQSEATPATTTKSVNTNTAAVKPKSTVAEVADTHIAGDTTISVNVLPYEGETEVTETPNTDETSAINPIATNLTYAATATSLAGAMLATKREIANKTRRF